MLDFSVAVCPSNFTYISAVRGCYSLGSDRVVWSDAVNRCKLLHSNAHLVVINSAAEQTAVVDLWSNNTGDCFNQFICIRPHGLKLARWTYICYIYGTTTKLRPDVDVCWSFITDFYRISNAVYHTWHGRSTFT